MHRSDRNILLGLLMVACLALVVIWGSTDEQVVGSEAARTPQKTTAPQRYRYADGKTKRMGETFPFDPNTADSTTLLRLGLRPWQVRNIYKYREKGGVYRKKTDFARLYGLSIKDYRRLEPFIRIDDDLQPASTLVADVCQTAYEERMDTLQRQLKIGPNERVALNDLDVESLKMVPGVGPYYAQQIVQYGKRLGGYASVDQLDEIDGFPADAKPYFTVNPERIRKLNVNKLSWQQLRQHPYLNFYQAKTITEYRRIHGTIRNIRVLQLCEDFKEKDFVRLEPYITY